MARSFGRKSRAAARPRARGRGARQAQDGAPRDLESKRVYRIQLSVAPMTSGSRRGPAGPKPPIARRRGARHDC